MTELIQMKAGRLVVPDSPVIPYIEGDGVGQDIWPATQTVVDKAVAAALSGSRSKQEKRPLQLSAPIYLTRLLNE